MRPVSGTRSELHPSNATVRSPRQLTPGTRGGASGPATTSNSAFSGAGPSRRRTSRSAFSDTAGNPRPSSPAVSFPHTWPYPRPGNNPSATTKYTPTRDGSTRSRRCTVRVCASTSSTSSNGSHGVSSPRCPGASTPAATVTARVTVTMADSVRNRTSGDGKIVMG